MKFLQTIAFMLAVLIISVPVCFAEEINLITDANGNLIYDGEFYREYNSLNQLVRIYNGSDSSAPLLQEFEFDPVEERIVKKVTFLPNGNPRETVIYFSQYFVRVDYHNGTVRDTEYVYLDGQLVAQVIDEETLFIHGNHEGSSSVVTDSSGNVVEDTTYSPFGEVLTGGEASRFGYEAKEHDSVIGDTDFHFRKYQPEWGLFIKPDTLTTNIYNPQDLNRYSFERNNPHIYEDSDGHNPALGYLFGAATLLGATVYWIITPIDYDNPQWGERLGKGLLHGVNAGVHATLAVVSGGTSMAGGAFRYTASWTLQKAAIYGLAAGSSHIYSNVIDGTQINPVAMGVDVGIGAGTSGLGSDFAGQYFPYRNALTKQTAKMVVDSYIQYGISLSALSFVNNLYSNPVQANDAGVCYLNSGRSGESSGGSSYKPSGSWSWDDYSDASGGGDAISGWLDYLDYQLENE